MKTAMRGALLVATVCSIAARPSVVCAGADDKVLIGYCTGELEKAKAAGFNYAEPAVRNIASLSDEEFAALAERYKSVGLPTPVGNLFLPNELKVVGPGVDSDAQMAYVRKAFDRARRLGLKIIVFGSAGARSVPEGFSREEAFQQLVAFGKRIAPEAEKQGIVVAVEPLRKEETNMINTIAEGLQWVKAAGHPSFQLMVDLYHLASEKEDPAVLLGAATYIKHVHIANPKGRAFPMSAEEYDYAGFFSVLHKMGYRGRISVEGRTNDLSVEGPKAIAFLRAAYALGAPKSRGR